MSVWQRTSQDDNITAYVRDLQLCFPSAVSQSVVPQPRQRRTTSERTNERTLERTNERTLERTNERTLKRTNSNERTLERTNDEQTTNDCQGRQVSTCDNNATNKESPQTEYHGQ